MKKTILSILFYSIISTSSAQSVDSVTIARLEFFAKAYNLVKFYYPSDELVNFDWDKWAAYKIESIIHIKNDAQYIDSIQRYFEEIAPGVAFIPKRAPYPIHRITPPNPEEYPDTTYFQYSLGLNTQEVDAPITLNYRYKRTPNHRKYYQSELIDKFEDKILKIEIIAKVQGQNTLDTNILFKVKYKDKEIVHNYIIDSFSVIFTKNTYDTFKKEILLSKNIQNFSYCFKYPSTDYILDILKWKITIKMDSGWVDIDSLPIHTSIKSPIEFISKDTYKDSVHELCALNVYNTQLYPITDTSVWLQYNQYQFYVPMKLFCNKKNTYPIVSKDISYYKHIKQNDSVSLFKSIALLSKMYGYLYYDYPYMDQQFKTRLSTSYANAIINRIEVPKRKTIIWLENEFLNLLGDPHMDLKRVKTNLSKNLTTLFNVTTIDDRVFVSSSSDTSYIKDGDEILKIENTSVSSIFKKLENNSSIIQKNRYVSNLIYDNLNLYKILRLDIMRDSQILHIEVPAYNDSMKDYTKNIIFKKINDSITYFNINARIDNSNDRKIRNMAEEYIISILSQNNKSNHYLIFKGHGDWLEKKFNLYSKLDTPLNKIVLFNKTKIIPFNQYSWDTSSLLKNIGNTTNSTFGIKKIIILIDRYSQSSDELHLFPIINHPKVVLVGENTAGAYGVINRVYLSDEFNFDYTSNKMGYNDHLGHYHNQQYYGIKPNIYLHRNATSFKDHKNYFLDKTIEMIQNGTLEKETKAID